MGDRANNADAIVDAACRLFAEHGGSERLTHSAVAAAAGVSRPTVYRWFATRNSLLEAMATRQERRFYDGLVQSMETKRTPADRLDAALRYLVTYLDETFGTAPAMHAPGFTVRTLAGSLPKQRATWAGLVGDALAQLPAVRDGELTAEQAAELFLRLAYSHYLIPSPDPEALLQCMRSMAGLTARSPRIKPGPGAPRPS